MEWVPRREICGCEICGGDLCGGAWWPPVNAFPTGPHILRILARARARLVPHPPLECHRHVGHHARRVPLAVIG